MNHAHRLLLPCSLALLAACSTQPKPSVSVEEKQLGRCPMQLHTGQTLTVTLPSNPTTGFRWEVRDGAANVLQSLGPEVYSNPEDSGLVGAGGLSTWRFTAREPGEGRLLLTYQQPWEQNVPPAQTFECEIRVK